MSVTDETSVHGAAPTGRRLDRNRLSLTGSGLVLPAVVLLVAGFVWPVVYSIYLGFTNAALIGPTARRYRVTGMANVDRLIDDPVFTKSLVLTGVFVLLSGVVFATSAGLALSLIMRRASPVLRGLVGALVLAAWVLPPVTAATLWRAATTSEGTFASMIGQPQLDLLGNYPLLIVCLANTWGQAGLAMLTFSAALRNVPRDIEEAAIIEGAGAVRRFVSVVLPLLKPTVVTNVLLIMLLSLANFALVYIMTGGGPGNDTMILPLYSYQQGFTFHKLGYGALIGNVMIAIAGIIGFLYVRTSRLHK